MWPDQNEYDIKSKGRSPLCLTRPPTWSETSQRGKLAQSAHNGRMGENLPSYKRMVCLCVCMHALNLIFVKNFVMNLFFSQSDKKRGGERDETCCHFRRGEGLLTGILFSLYYVVFILNRGTVSLSVFSVERGHIYWKKIKLEKEIKKLIRTVTSQHIWPVTYIRV